VESPLAGLVGRVLVDIGSHVSTATPVALVVNLEKVKINLEIPERFLAKVSLGQQAKVEVDAYPQEVFLGTITQISPVVNLENRAAPVEITLENKEGLLKSGMFAHVSLIVNKVTSVPAILKEAIIGKEPDTYAYLIENNKAVLRKIALGLHQGPYYEVREGIKEGDLVVIVGQQRLRENTEVVLEIENGQGEKR
jgi:RND family efflux transporter MFP subunit